MYCNFFQQYLTRVMRQFKIFYKFYYAKNNCYKTINICVSHTLKQLKTKKFFYIHI